MLKKKIKQNVKVRTLINDVDFDESEVDNDGNSLEEKSLEEINDELLDQKIAEVYLDEHRPEASSLWYWGQFLIFFCD